MPARFVKMRPSGQTQRSYLQQVVSSLGCRLLRLLERALPVFVLAWWLLSWSLVVCLIRLLARPRLRRRLLRSPLIVPKNRATFRTFLRVWRASSLLMSARCLRFWPDRLHAHRWQRRCHWIGVEHLEAVLNGGRPVILAGLHFGPLKIIRPLLRSRGWPVATLATSPLSKYPDYQERLYLASDAVNGLQGKPHLFDLAQLRRARRFLSRGGALYIAMDGHRGRHVPAQHGLMRMTMATGPLRLAAAAGAAVIPCLIWCNKRPLEFTVSLGSPVPAELIDLSERHGDACQTLLKSMAPVVLRNPEQYSPLLLRHLQPSRIKSFTNALAPVQREMT